MAAPDELGLLALAAQRVEDHDLAARPQGEAAVGQAGQRGELGAFVAGGDPDPALEVEVGDPAAEVGHGRQAPVGGQGEVDREGLDPDPLHLRGGVVVQVPHPQAATAAERDQLMISAELGALERRPGLERAQQAREHVEDALAGLKSELEKEDADVEAINNAANALAQASMKLGEAMYKAQAGGGEDVEHEVEGKGDGVVDADFEEVDGDKKD